MNKAFLQFCQIFAIFDDFSKWSTLKVLQNFEKLIKYGKILAKKWRKVLFNLPSTHFLADSEYPKIGFRVPVLPLLKPYTQSGTKSPYFETFLVGIFIPATHFFHTVILTRENFICGLFFHEWKNYANQHFKSKFQYYRTT